MDIYKHINGFDDAHWVREHGRSSREQRIQLEAMPEEEKDELIRNYWDMSSRLLKQQQNSPEEQELRRLWQAHGENLAYLVATAESEDGVYECPLCGGEGTVEGCAKSPTTWLSDQLGSAGLQVFGIGDGHQQMQRLLDLLLKRRQKHEG